MEQSATLSGVGLHSGKSCAVTLAIGEGPTTIGTSRALSTLISPVIVSTEGGVRIALSNGDEIELVEHLAAAIGGLGAHRNITITSSGGEIPLLDGGARSFTEALLAIGAKAHDAPLRVTKPMSLSIGDSLYELAPSNETQVDVQIDFAHPRIGSQRASWQGDRVDFQRRIAPARTFGFVRDAALLASRGRASGVSISDVILFAEHDLAPGSELHGDDEPARHKLLDLIGDLALYGGPPRGLVRATRPGHTATHEMVRRALAAGALRYDEAIV